MPDRPADPGCTRAPGPHAHGLLSGVQRGGIETPTGVHPTVNGAPILLGDRVHVLVHGEHVWGTVRAIIGGNLPPAIHVARDRPLPGWEVTVDVVLVAGGLLEHFPATRTATPPF